jgi:hypothetical protein
LFPFFIGKSLLEGINMETKIFREVISKYEELEQQVNEYLRHKQVVWIKWEVAGGYIFVFITHVA